MNEEEKIELRSEEFQEVLGYVPPWILQWGVTAIAVIVVVLLIGSAIIKYPDVIPAPVVLTGSVPPAAIVARSSGKLKVLFVGDKQVVKMGDYLAVIDNPADTEDVKYLKQFLDCFVVPPRNDVDTVFHPGRHCEGASPKQSSKNQQSGLLHFVRNDGNENLLPDKNLQLGNLQSLYSSFYTTLFEYNEYKRLSYFPQKIRMTKERIVQYEAQHQNLLRQQKIVEEQFVLAQKLFQRDSLLHEKSLISREEYEKSQNVYLSSAMSKENMQSSVNNMQIQITQLKESLLDTGQQDIEKSNSLQTQLQSLVSQLKTEIQAWELSYVLIAPVDGTITFNGYWTTNQNVTGGDEVFTVIPEAGLLPSVRNDGMVIGKALLPIARSGKVKAGQKVNIRLENFPDNEFGILRGVVKNISLVPSQTGQIAHYTVEMSLINGMTTTYQKELPFLPNMQGKAEIITADLSLLERFVLPLKKIISESL